MHRNIAGWVTHHWAKWVVVVLSLVFVGGIGGTFGPKLAEIQENDIASFLPGDAESTQVITKSAQLGADPDAVPVVVLYVRDSGITPDDAAKVAADAQAIPAMASVADEVAGPVPSEDGKALQLIATIQVGDEGFEELPTGRRGHPGHRREGCRRTRGQPGWSRPRSALTRPRPSPASTVCCCCRRSASCSCCWS